MKGKTHELNHDLTFSAHIINYVCHSIKAMFRVLGTYNFVRWLKFNIKTITFLYTRTPKGFDIPHLTMFK